MDNEQPTYTDQIANNDDQPNGQKRKTPKLLLTVIVIIASLVALAGAFYIGTIYSGSSNKVGSNSEENAANDDNVDDQTFQTVLTAGYPYEVADQTKVVTKLAIPDGLMAISVSSTIQDPGLSDILANKFNDEMGRWTFDNPSTSEASIGSLSLIHIGDEWLSEDYDGEVRVGAIGYTGEYSGYDLSTSASRNSSIDKMTSDTKACADDPAKGLVIATAFNVCYEIIHTPPQATGTYSPLLNILGVGVHEGRTYVLAGYLRLAEWSEYESDAVRDQKYKDFASGDIPSETTARANDYLDALAQTTITFEDRS